MSPGIHVFVRACVLSESDIHESVWSTREMPRVTGSLRQKRGSIRSIRLRSEFL